MEKLHPTGVEPLKLCRGSDGGPEPCFLRSRQSRVQLGGGWYRDGEGWMNHRMWGCRGMPFFDRDGHIWSCETHIEVALSRQAPLELNLAPARIGKMVQRLKAQRDDLARNHPEIFS